MGIVNIKREHMVETVTIADAAVTSTIFQVNNAYQGAIHMGAAHTGTSMTFQGAEARDGSFAEIKETDGSTASITVGTSRWTELPSQVFAFHSAKLIAADTQGATRTIIVSLKS